MAKKKQAPEQPPEMGLIIENEGPIERFVVTLQPGKAVVIEGSNGAGKTKVLNDIQALCGDKEALSKLTVRDGAEAGRICGFGREIRIGAKITQTGSLRWYCVEEGISLARFVKPGFKSADANDRERLRNIANILGITIDPKEVARLVGGCESDRQAAEDGGILAQALPAIEKREAAAYNRIASTKTLDASEPTEFVKLLKKDLDEAALACEKTAEKLVGQADGIESTLPDIVECETDEEVLTDAVAAAKQHKADLERKAQDAVAAEQLIEAAKELMQAGQGQTVADATENLKAAEKSLAESRSLIAEMEHSLALERQKAAMLSEQVEERQNDVASAMQRQQQWADAEQNLKLQAIAPTDEEWVEAEKAIKAAADAMLLGGRMRDAVESMKTVEELRRESSEMTAEAVRLRAVAQNTLNLLAGPINALKCGLEVDSDLRLICTDHPVRGRCYVEDLSQGEIWSLTFRLMTKMEIGTETRPAIAVIPQEALEGLDGINLEKFKAALAETHIALACAHATTDVEIGEHGEERLKRADLSARVL